MGKDFLGFAEVMIKLRVNMCNYQKALYFVPKLTPMYYIYFRNPIKTFFLIFNFFFISHAIAKAKVRNKTCDYSHIQIFANENKPCVFRDIPAALRTEFS